MHWGRMHLQIMIWIMGVWDRSLMTHANLKVKTSMQQSVLFIYCTFALAFVQCEHTFNSSWSRTHVNNTCSSSNERANLMFNVGRGISCRSVYLRFFDEVDWNNSIFKFPSTGIKYFQKWYTKHLRSFNIRQHFFKCHETFNNRACAFKGVY